MTATAEFMARPDTDRVRANTSSKINELIDERTIEHLCNYVGLSNELISHRIEELNREHAPLPGELSDDHCAHPRGFGINRSIPGSDPIEMKVLRTTLM